MSQAEVQSVNAVAFEKMMIRAASVRRRVLLIDGTAGELVFWPRSGTLPGKRPPRHGDREMAGVRRDGNHRDRIDAVHPFDVIGFDEVTS